MNAKSLCAVAATLALGLAACGDDDDDSGDSGSPPPRMSEGIPVTETEYKIDTVARVKAGSVTFGVRNDGQETHALEVEGNGIEEETEDIPPGEGAPLEVDLKEGTYELYCPIGDHKDRGMTAELVVGGGGGASNEDDDSSGSDDDSGGAQAPSGY